MSKVAHTASHAPYIVPLKNYVINACALALLMTLTVAMSFVNMGPFNPIVAVAIAIVKAVLIVLFFMNTWYNTRLTWIFVSLSFFWMLILFGMFLPDYFARDFQVHPNEWQSSAFAVTGTDLPMDRQLIQSGGHLEH